VKFIPILQREFEFRGPFLSLNIEGIKAYITERDAFVNRFIDVSKREANSVVEIPYFCLGLISKRFAPFSRKRNTFLALVTQDILDIYKKIKLYVEPQSNVKPIVINDLKGIGKSFSMAVTSKHEWIIMIQYVDE